jgi:hypothetical protein
MPSGSRRRKRKRRQASRAGGPGDASRGSRRAPRDASPPRAGAEGGPYARARAKDEAARRALAPLAEGERPAAVTVGAVVAFLLGASNLVLYAAGFEIRGERPAFAAVVLQSGLMLVAAWGMWRARYWAVLGMEVILGFVIVIFGVLAVTASSVAAVLISIAMVAAAGTLFYFLIKAMARLQMPERRA